MAVSSRSLHYFSVGEPVQPNDGAMNADHTEVNANGTPPSGCGWNLGLPSALELQGNSKVANAIDDSNDDRWHQG